MCNTDERRKAFEERMLGVSFERGADGAYTQKLTWLLWRAFNMGCKYMESRLDSDEVVEAVAKGISIGYYHRNGLETLVGKSAEDYSKTAWLVWDKEAKAALAALKGSL